VALAWLEYGCVSSTGIELDNARHELGKEALEDVSALFAAHQVFNIL